MTGESTEPIHAESSIKNKNYRHAIKAKKVVKININPIIETAFSNFTVGEKVIPISFLNYTGNSDVYLNYYTWFDKPENFYDDENHGEVAFGTIDICSKCNFKNILEAIKTKLKENGFTWTDNGPETYEKDTGYYHVPVNFYYS